MCKKSLSLLLIILIFWCPLRCLGAGCPCDAGSNLQELTGADATSPAPILPCCCDNRMPTAGSNLNDLWNPPIDPLDSGKKGKKCPCENCQCLCSGATLSSHFVLHMETLRQFAGQYKASESIIDRMGIPSFYQLGRIEPRSNFLHASRTGRQIRCVLESFLI